MERTASKPVTFVPRPYGSKLELTDNLQIIIIDPHKNTGLGVESCQLNNYGLRHHPGAKSEHVTFLKFADGEKDDGTTPLVYRFQNRRRVDSQYFGVGSEFYSVQKDEDKTGFWHILENDSDRPIMLLIRVEEDISKIPRR